MKRLFKKYTNLYAIGSSIYYKVCAIRDAIERSLLIKTVPFFHKFALKRLKKKKIIKCIFLAVDSTDWKYDTIYDAMANHPRFDPVIVICPMVNWGVREMNETMERCVSFFCKKSYNFILSFDKTTGSNINIKKELSPDIIFYTNPYRSLIDHSFFVTRFLRYLTVYVPYHFGNNRDLEFSHNLLLHNLVWRLYKETSFHGMKAIQNSDNKGRNVVISGYPGIEKYINGYKPRFFPWKLTNPNLKRIIWAPHHSIEHKGSVIFSCFLQYAYCMLGLADKYRDEVQFVFKPHPLLKVKLIQLWGEKKTLEYYNKWKNGKNTSICEGEYTDLFLTSDAMVHDCGSFITEYLYMNKPVMRTMNDIPMDEMLDDLALQSLKHYYKAYNADDIEKFIKNIILDNDPMREERLHFVQDRLLPPKGKMPSQNIIDDIIDSVDNQILYRN